MSLLAFLLVLSAAFFHATWNFLVKRIDAGPELIFLFSLVSSVIYLPVALYALAAAGWSVDRWQLLFILGSALLHLAYFRLLQIGYSKGDLSLVYPTARATGPLLSAIFAVLVLGDILTPTMALGAAIIIFGVLMLGGGARRANNFRASLLFGLGIGALIGSYTVWDAYAVTALAVSPILLDWAANLGRGLMMTPFALRRGAAVAALWRDHRWEVCAIALFAPLAYTLVLYALTFTPVTYVAPLREVSVVLNVLAGSLLLGEGHLRRRLGWSLVILAGMAVLVTADG